MNQNGKIVPPLIRKGDFAHPKNIKRYFILGNYNISWHILHEQTNSSWEMIRFVQIFLHYVKVALKLVQTAVNHVFKVTKDGRKCFLPWAKQSSVISELNPPLPIPQWWPEIGLMQPPAWYCCGKQIMDTPNLSFPTSKNFSDSALTHSSVSKIFTVLRLFAGLFIFWSIICP